MSPRPVVSILTDFGARDPSGAICEGVILGICPEAAVIQVSHEVTKFAIRDGALMLWCALRTCRSGCTWRSSTLVSGPPGARWP
jgi:S-adenosylmethionine hydrolase